MPISDFLEMYPELCVRGLKEMVTLGSNGRCERGRLLGGGRCRMC